MKNVNALHPWVRAALAAVAVLSVPGLIVASLLGATISLAVAAVVGTTAVCALCLAFGQKFSVPNWAAGLGLPREETPQGGKIIRRR